MNHWPFIIASYVIVLGGTAMVIAESYLSMRKSEAKAEKLKRARK